jgi:hypothetical protein
MGEHYFRGKMPLPLLSDELWEWIPSHEIAGMNFVNEKKE